MRHLKSEQRSFCFPAGLMLLACWILLTVMICPFQVQAQEKVLASGKDGNISWKAVYDPDAVYSEQFPDGGMRILYLSGTGDMKDYEGMETFCPGSEWAPWIVGTYDAGGEQRTLNWYNKIVIGRGITSIGKVAFGDYLNWPFLPREIVIPDTVTRTVKLKIRVN